MYYHIIKYNASSQSNHTEIMSAADRFRAAHPIAEPLFTVCAKMYNILPDDNDVKKLFAIGEIIQKLGHNSPNIFPGRFSMYLTNVMNQNVRRDDAEDWEKKLVQIWTEFCAEYS